MAIIEVTPNLESSLYLPLKKSFEAKKVKVSEETSFYINRLLADCIKSANFHSLSGLGDSDKPLALMVNDAFKAPTTDERLWKFVAIGDYSFFVSSFCFEQINKRLGSGGRMYCMSIGSNSYLEACSLFAPSKREMSKLYLELGKRFTELVIVAESALESIL